MYKLLYLIYIFISGVVSRDPLLDQVACKCYHFGVVFFGRILHNVIVVCFPRRKKVSSRVIPRMLRSDLAEYHTGMSLEDAIKYIRNPPKKFGRYAAHVVNVLN